MFIIAAAGKEIISCLITLLPSTAMIIRPDGLNKLNELRAVYIPI
jgi:hypothetical protein